MDKEKINYIMKQNHKNNNNDYDFMPGLIEIIEKPANKGGYFIIITISLMISAALIWSYFSKVDIVVELDGVIQTSEVVTTEKDSDKEKSEYILKVNVNNRDIADIKVNDNVNVKIEAYSYGDYGMFQGKVSHINENAEYSQMEGYIFPVEIKFDKIENNNIQLRGGMNATADICIGKRRIIEFVLEPLFDAIRKSASEK